MSIYFDNAATTSLSQESKTAMMEAMESFGNPSSTHSEGRKAKAIIETVRKNIASRLGCKASEIIFTCGGTEADNWALISGVKNCGITDLYTSEIEHHAVTHVAEYIEQNGLCKVHYIPHDKNGVHDISWLENELKEKSELDQKVMISLMHANNEIGNIIDIQALSETCKKYGAYFHSDTVQTMAHLPLDFSKIKLDFAACSGHKFHGPKGVGFAFVRQGIICEPFILGGAQERSHRAGTENVIGIAGLGAAFNLCFDDISSDLVKVTEVKKYAIQRLKSVFPKVQFNGLSGDLDQSLYTVLNFYHPDLHSNGMLNFQLDINGIQCSGGSACSSGAVGGSHVLNAISSPGGTRISFSRYSSKEEVDKFIDVLKKVKSEL